MQQLGEDEAQKQIDDLFSKIDADGSGDISLKELAVWYFCQESKMRMKQKMVSGVSIWRYSVRVFLALRPTACSAHTS